MIVVNGCPKSGTHAVMALLQRMGLRRCPGSLLGCLEQPLHISGNDDMTLAAARRLPDNVFLHAHVSAHHQLTGFPVITVFRNPRNVLVSYCRHRARDGEVVTIAQAIIDFWGAPFVAVYRSFLGWRGYAACLRYEDLPGSVVGDGAGLYHYADRDYNTRTGAPSDWSEHWSAEAQETWVANGGPELLADAGYN